MSSKRLAERLKPVDAALYRRTCAHFATGITVVTVVDQGGRPHGMTVNSFSSISLDPPLVLVSIDARNAILGHFLSTAAFGISILAHNQERLSRRFSSPSENRFHNVDWRPGDSGVPLLEGALGHLECAVARTLEMGDHAVLVGEVRAAAYSGGAPLIFFNSSYRELR